MDIEPQHEEERFSDADAAICENALFGNSYPIQTPDGKLNVGPDNLGEGYNINPHEIRSPHNATKGLKSIEDINEARIRQGKLSGLAMMLYGIDGFRKMMAKGLKGQLILPPLSTEGEIPHLEVEFLDRDGMVVNPDVVAEIGMVVDPALGNMLSEAKPTEGGMSLVYQFEDPKIKQ